MLKLGNKSHHHIFIAQENTEMYYKSYNINSIYLLFTLFWSIFGGALLNDARPSL